MDMRANATASTDPLARVEIHPRHGRRSVGPSTYTVLPLPARERRHTACRLSEGVFRRLSRNGNGVVPERGASYVDAGVSASTLPMRRSAGVAEPNENS